MVRDNPSRPTVLVPYPGPAPSSDIQDIFVYLRPEANGVRVESAVLRVVENCSAYKKDLHLAYLANIPGQFIVRNHIIERHYALKLHFAVHGKSAFTPFMRDRFRSFFGVEVNEARILGAFEALKVLRLTPEDLFSTWVEWSDVLTVNGQTIKQIDGLYVINYDIPAILHKNNRNTDIAAMIFRTSLPFSYFQGLVEEMVDALSEASILDNSVHPSRIFHYSKSPFEQVLDGIGYLWSGEDKLASLEDLSFARYLRENGVSFDQTLGVLQNPIVSIRAEDGSTFETNLILHTAYDSYPAALEKFRRIESQVLIRAAERRNPRSLIAPT